MTTRTKLSICSVILTLAIAFYGSVIALEDVRFVIIITVFAAAFGAGASTTALLWSIKQDSASRKTLG